MNVLSRLINYMELDKRLMVMKAFIESQFDYCTLIWLVHSRTLSNKINRLHKRALRIVYSDYSHRFVSFQKKINHFQFIIKIFRV